MFFNQTNRFVTSNMSSFSSLYLQYSADDMDTAAESIPLENRPPIMATFISLYALIFFFGISGNVLVVRKSP